MMVKDYRGKNGQRAVWKFDAPLGRKYNDVIDSGAFEDSQAVVQLAVRQRSAGPDYPGSFGPYAASDRRARLSHMPTIRWAPPG